MIGVFWLESQMLPGDGKFDRTGIGSDRDARESTNTAFIFLKANSNRISGSISTTTKDYNINYQDLQGTGMTGGWRCRRSLRSALSPSARSAFANPFNCGSGTVPAEQVGSFNLIFYQSAEDAVFKALGME